MKPFLMDCINSISLILGQFKFIISSHHSKLIKTKQNYSTDLHFCTSTLNGTPEALLDIDSCSFFVLSKHFDIHTLILLSSLESMSSHYRAVHNAETL